MVIPDRRALKHGWKLIAVPVNVGIAQSRGQRNVAVILMDRWGPAQLQRDQAIENVYTVPDPPPSLDK